MEWMYKVDQELKVPIYQQLTDMIKAAVKRGDLKDGQKLPTVQELSEQLSVARGTIKRAYDELEREGIVEKAQGSGTFVRYQQSDGGSRKEQAMAAIDALLKQLEGMGLSAAEISIFLNLKLREWAEQEDYIKVAVVECNQENLAQMSKQLRHIPQVELHSFLLDNVKQYPYKLGEDYDLIIVTAAHAEYLENVLPVKRRVVKVAIRPSARCLSGIIRMQKGTRVGIMGSSRKFCELLQSACETYAEEIVVEPPVLFEEEEAAAAYLQDKDVLLVPKDYEQYCTPGILDQLLRFEGEMIPCYYEMDEGSILYLETKMKRLLEKKRI